MGRELTSKDEEFSGWGGGGQFNVFFTFDYFIKFFSGTFSLIRPTQPHQMDNSAEGFFFFLNIALNG